MLRTKIICTIGPASRSLDMLKAMIHCGMNVARLNFSHGDQDYHGDNIDTIRRAAAELDVPVAILVDLQGPRLRVGQMQGDGVMLKDGEELVLTTRPVLGHAGEVPLQYKKLPQLVEPGDRILMDDGLLEVVVIEASGTDIRCKIITGGLLQSNKGINLPRAHLSIPAMSKKDRQDLAFSLERGADWIALSFVRNASEVAALQELIRKQSVSVRPIPVIAKIEKPEALQNIDAIIAAADGIMVARGDLGIEASPEEVPMVQKQIIAKCNSVGVPVITATQMLDSMIRNPRPTRAEASDVANAILDGSDAIMLSGETAIGAYPLQALQTMVKIAARAEVELQRRITLLPISRSRTASVADAVSHAARDTAQDLDAAAIITPTVSGHTARMVSRYRPTVPIVAVTPSPMVQRQLCLHWGVYPLLAPRTDNTDRMLADAVKVARDHGLVSAGDLVVVTGGAAGSRPGTTNLIQVHVVQRILSTGVGIGARRVQGRVRLVSDHPPAPEEIAESDILVLKHTSQEHLGVARKAAGLIVEEGGMDSCAARMAQDLDIIALIGATDAFSVLKDGQEVTLDPVSGRVCEGLDIQ